MNKSEVCVKLTRKNCKKVLGILEMFGEQIWEYSKLKEGCYGYYPVFAMMQGGEWLVNLADTGKTIVKPRKLRNILAKEHLKKGDVGVFICAETNSEYVVKFDRVIYGSFYGEKWIKSDVGIPCEGIICFYNFLRYATDEEKALLEPKQTIETVDPVNSFTGYVPGQATYTREVWVNHYSDQEFHIHYNKEIAELHSRINNGFGKDVQTVKATLTYDIPMTKV